MSSLFNFYLTYNLIFSAEIIQSINVLLLIHVTFYEQNMYYPIYSAK
jgi:hypothetical protein